MHSKMRKCAIGVAITATVLALVGSFDLNAPRATATTGVSTLHGIDACSSYSYTTWNEWYGNTNDSNLGLYIGGVHGGCYHPNATFFNNLYSNWGILPIWDDRQSSCSGQVDQITQSSNSAAYNQGVASADAADLKLAQDGFGAQISYLDLEPFDPTGNCTAIVQNYVSGWVHELHADGDKAGLYINGSHPGGNLFAHIASVPDDVWIADYNGTNSASPSAVDTTKTSTGYWTHDQRMHQYDEDRTAKPSGVNTTVSYDPDAVDATILFNTQGS